MHCSSAQAAIKVTGMVPQDVSRQKTQQRIEERSGFFGL
jgi:hypothetical protein